MRTGNPAAAPLAVSLALAIAAAMSLSGCGPAPDSAAPAAAPKPNAVAAASAPAVPRSPEAASARYPDDMVAAANAAFRDGRLFEPAGDNALELTAKALDDEPGHLAASELMADLFPLAVSRAESRIGAGDFAGAGTLIALLDASMPGSPSVAALRGRLGRVEADQLAAAEREVVRTLAREAAERDAANQPAREREAAAEAAGAAAVAATPPPTAASPPPVPAAGEVVRVPVASARPVGSQAPATVEPRTAAEPAVEPSRTPPSPASVPSANDRAPVVIERPPPVYPQLARQRRIEGWVDLEFTVGIDGRVDNVEIIAAEPANVFDTAAERALLRWRFEPAFRDGAPAATRTRTRINFTLS